MRISWSKRTFYQPKNAMLSYNIISENVRKIINDVRWDFEYNLHSTYQLSCKCHINNVYSSFHMCKAHFLTRKYFRVDALMTEKNGTNSRPRVQIPMLENVFTDTIWLLNKFPEVPDLQQNGKNILTGTRDDNSRGSEQCCDLAIQDVEVLVAEVIPHLESCFRLLW